MKRLDLKRLVPLGVNAQQELTWMLVGWIFSAFYSLCFVYMYQWNYRLLFDDTIKGARVLDENAVMPDFVTLLDHYLIGFLLVALCMLAIVAYHYLYHRQGSKSIYTMRRLSDGMELHRRCWTLPVLMALASLLAAFVLLMIYYAIYMFVTPDACLTPGQWQKLWSVIL